MKADLLDIITLIVLSKRRMQYSEREECLAKQQMMEAETSRATFFFMSNKL